MPNNQPEPTLHYGALRHLGAKLANMLLPEPHLPPDLNVLILKLMAQDAVDADRACAVEPV